MSMKNLLKVTVLALIISGCASNQIDRDQSKKHFVRYGETIIFIASSVFKSVSIALSFSMYNI